MNEKTLNDETSASKNIEREIDDIEELQGSVDLLSMGMNLQSMTSMVSGAIFRKAEFENNYGKVYSHVITKMTQFEFTNNGNENVLEVFGVIGG